MPIRFQYDAAAVVPPSSNELKKYGGQMLMQQRKYDLDQRNDQARISQLGSMRNFNAEASRGEPSRAEQAYFRDQAIRSGAFAPGVVKNIRDLEAEQRRLLRNRSLNATQMADAMSQLDAQMQVAMSMGYPQQMVEARNQIASGPRQPMTSAQAFAADPKLEEKFMGYVDPNNPDGSPKPYEQRLQEALAISDARKKILSDQPQGQVAPGDQQPMAPGMQVRMLPEQRSAGSGLLLYATNPTMQGQMPPQSSAGNPASMVRDIALAPGHPDYKPVPTPTNQRDEEGYVIMSDGSKVDPRDSFAMSTGGRGQQAVVRLTHPNGSPKERRPPESYLELAGEGASPVMAQGGFQGMGQGAGQRFQPEYRDDLVYRGVLNNPPQVVPMAGQQAAPAQPATQATPVTPPQAAPTTTPAKKGARGYVSISPQGQSVTALGRNAMYNERGEFVGDTGLYDQQGADYIRRQAAGVQPMAQPVSTGRAGFDAAMGSNLDTAYDLANMDRSPGTNFFNPENPAYAAMRAPAPQQSTGNVGQFKGRYGLGGVDYGINPATGNRVTASIRPGGGLEFDEPVGKPGTAMGGRKGSVTIMGRRKKPAAGAEVSPGVSTPEQQAAYNALPEAPVVPQTAPAVAGANYQYQSPIAQTVANVPQPATPARKYGGSSLISPAGMEVEAAMQAGEELAAREQAAEAARQQQAFQFATAPPPVSMSDEERKRLGLPTSKELMEMRRSIDQNKAMGGISLGGTGRAAGSYEPPTSPQKPKETPKAGKSASQQTGMSQAIKDFASKQKPDVQKAIMEAYDTKLSDRLRENAVRFLLSIGIDLDNMAPSS